MQIDALTIRIGMQVKRYEFVHGFNLITSDGENSVGKTTLIRSILYALGENVPGTQKFRFTTGGKEFQVNLSEGNRHISLLRSKQTIQYRENGHEDRYALPHDLRAIKARLFGITNPLQLDNLLGACYIDQDRGWTLLNRGNVISKVSFNIEDFIRGLANCDQSKEQTQLLEIKQETRRYTFAKDTAGYQRDVLEDETLPIRSIDTSRDFAKLQQLSMRASYLRKRIRAIRYAQSHNKKFIEYVENLKLSVKTETGEQIVVNADNLVGYNDQNSYLDEQVVQLSAELETAERGMENLQRSMSTDERLFEPGSEMDILDRRIADLKIDAGMFEKALKELNVKKKKIENAIEEELTHSEPYEFIANTVVDYTKRLGVYDDYQDDGQGILTDSLKEKSGAFYQSLVFAFRLAYAKAVEKFCCFRLPIIIDSPRSGELSTKNFALYMKLMKEEFSDWQVIIASISDDGILSMNTIRIKAQMMENAEIVTDLSKA